MDNSISINLNNGNNSMNPLVFFWTACFKDGSDIMQINEDGSENRFKLVQDRIEELKSFYLYNKDLTKIFYVNIEKGYLNCGNTEDIESKEIKNNIRLIYFRRHKVTMSASGKESNHDIKYHLGFQYNDINGNNRQIVLKIDEQGNWVIGD